ncbi:MAG: hypothetical protein WA324_30610, partial [Bryobacteraceae bacterium]
MSTARDMCFDGELTGTPPPQREPRLRFAILLLAVAGLCFIPRIVVTFRQFIQYDGWWHIMVARTGDWRATFEEIRDNAHPPLFYVLLHYLVKFGHSRLIYRLG